ncbi:MAG: FG-GAP repeat protein [Deltaproteobacteria bacterium]|nr:FG-GAP repeat protein [Deltaproteobacteria bacterium]
MDGDGLSDVLVGARGQDGGVKDAGAAYLLRSEWSLDPGCGTMSLADADLKLYGEATDDVAGEWVSGAGDVDGDGRADVIIGAFGHDPGGDYDKAGAAYLFLSGGIFEGALRRGEPEQR